MKTVYIFIPDDILPESGWIHGCTMCYNPTSSHINEPYEYYNEKINMNIMICNKCIKKLKSKPNYHYKRFIRKCKEDAAKKMQLNQYDESSEKKPGNKQDKKDKEALTNEDVSKIKFPPIAPGNYKKNIIEKLDKKLEFNFRNLIASRTKTTGTSTRDT